MFLVIDFGNGKLVPVVKRMYGGDASRIKGEYKSIEEARQAHPDLVTNFSSL